MPSARSVRRRASRARPRGCRSWRRLRRRRPGRRARRAASAARSASCPFDLDRAFRLRRDLGRLDLDPGLLERLADGAEVAGLAEHPQLVAVLAHVLGAGVDRGDQVVLAVAARRRRRSRPFSRRSRRPSRARRGCRRGLVKARRISALARLRLSVSASTRIADAAGAVALVEDPFDRRRRRRRRRCRGRSPAGCLSFGIEASRAFCTAVARVGLPSRSPPPSRAAT